MSYILEALRRAQAERERGHVPGLQAQPLADQPPPAGRPRALALGVAGGVALGLLGAASLWWWRDRPVAAPATTLATPPVQQAQTASAPVAVPSRQADAAPAPAPSLPVVVSAPAPLPAPAPPAPPAAPAPAKAPAPPVAASGAASPGVRLLRLAQLPADLRRELPPLNVGGAVWSESLASRFVILDGQLLREGDSVAPGLLLERIAQKAAWLRWRDLRIELAL